MKVSPLLTDLYQLTMLQGYFESGMNEKAVFEFFVRELPENRNFLIAAGLEQVISFVEELRFSSDEIEWLKSLRIFKKEFLEWLKELRFTGDLYAMPEGTIFFQNEPIIQICAPICEAQLIETRLINIVHYQTLVASKAIRMIFAAPGKLFIDFGLRRAHGAEAGLFAARASYIAGFSGTSTVLAGKLYGIPVFGTMAHSFIQAHESEISAFKNFALSMPENTVFLVDTYDTVEGVKNAIRVAKELEKEGIKIKGVRIDSGDLLSLSKKVREILDKEGFSDVKILTSGNLDEYVIKKLYESGAPIDGFGVGTLMVTSADSPYLNCAYKLMEYKGVPKRKRSEGKQTLPGRKQVYRYYKHGKMEFDVIALKEERLDGRPLIEQFIKDGKRVKELPSLEKIRAYVKEQIEELPEYLKKLKKSEEYPVKISEGIKRWIKKIDEDS